MNTMMMDGHHHKTWHDTMPLNVHTVPLLVHKLADWHSSFLPLIIIVPNQQIHVAIIVDT